MSMEEYDVLDLSDLESESTIPAHIDGEDVYSILEKLETERTDASEATELSEEDDEDET